MKSKTYLIILLFTVTNITYAQDTSRVSLNLADRARSLTVQEWIKGSPIQQFKENHIYVIEFWATGCKPCIATMPHVSELANKYKDKITVIGICVYETENTPAKKIQAFVNSLSRIMKNVVV